MGRLGKWTEDEDDFLIRCYNHDANFEELSLELPERTVVAIKSRVAKLKSIGKIKSKKEKNKDLSDDTRRCDRCGEIFPVSEFYTVIEKWKFHECKKCANERKRIAKAKKKKKNFLKKKKRNNNI